MSEFISNTYRAIDIIDGTDVQDSNLYNWLTENATQYNPASYCLINTNKYIARAHWGTSNISKMYLGEYNVFKSLPLLYTPTISLSGTNLTISTTDDNTYYFDIYANGTKVDSISTSYSVIVTFTNGKDISSWLATKIYKNYTITGDRLDLLSTDKIGEIATADGTTTVSTDTGKLLILCNDPNVVVISNTTITVSSNLTTDGYVTSGSGRYGICPPGMNYNVYIDNTKEYYSNFIYILSVAGDGSITFDRVDWDN